MKIGHFEFIPQENNQERGKIYLCNELFAHFWRNPSGYGGKYANKWQLNRHHKAFELGLEDQTPFNSIVEMKDFLEKWVKTKI